MAALIRNFNRLTRTSLEISKRSVHNAIDLETIKNETSEDEPVDMDNPYTKERTLCLLCKLGIEPDYKNVRLLSQFQSVYTGRIFGKHITGLCTSKQKKVEKEILKAQNAGLMGYYHKNPKYSRDPELFDANNPFKSHKF